MQPNEAYIRMMLGESIPPEGADSDTLFTDEQVALFLERGETELGAILEGWRAKEAHFSNLVNVTDGAASRAFSDLFIHAQAMVKRYTSLANPQAGRARVGRIQRSE